MRLFLCAVLLILLAYGGSLVRHRRRGASWLDHLFSTGFVFCVVGVLLGPFGIRLISIDMLGELQPFVIFSLGWVGFVVGMQADLSLLCQVPRSYVVFALAESGLTIAAVSAASGVVFWLLGVSGSALVLLSLLSGVCAGVSSQAVPALASRRTRKEESVFLRIVTGLDDIPSLIIVLVLFAYVGPGGEIYDFRSGVFWLAVTILLGLGFGLSFYFLLRPRAKFDETLAICIGVTVLSAGAAAYLHLAVPGIGFLAGFFVANVPLPKKQTFYNVLTVAERPIVFLMFLVAGANLRFESRWWLIPVVVYVVIRGLSKVWVGAILPRLVLPQFDVGRTIGWGLIAPGPLSIAVVLDYLCVQSGPSGPMLLWMVTVGAVASEFIVPVAMKRLGLENGQAI